ncbi:MAG: 3-phosphoshikimate 1-carboxyvinyltransferase [Candidatus Gastranaerophilales bacterium]|nr:3-phosphoshikimate 1-carboxyvinyltransferase [Candidatus Gastranaerophilales bacterium]
MEKRVSKSKHGLRGCVVIPSDKSISHRSVMFTSLAKGKSIINNFSDGADCISTLNLFRQLGINIEYTGEKTLTVNSSGILKYPEQDLNCGNSGTTMRLCSGILASRDFDTVLYGDESLSKRPMKRVIDPLMAMGADIQSNDYKAPLRIKGKNLTGIVYNSPLASAQVKSCILLAGLNADGKTTVTEPYLSRNHTELMLKYMGADIAVNGNSVSISRSKLEPAVIDIAGDISSAAFFIAAGLIVPNSEIILKNVGLNPTRNGIINVVKRMGGNIEILSENTTSGEIVGDIKVHYSELNSCEISGADIPGLIDELPVIALISTQARGRTVIKDAQDLRKKESDRISTVATALKSLGANVEEQSDGFIINGKTNLTGGVELETFHDHRLAMTYYIAGLISKSEILIKDFEWVNTSFPEFETLINKLYS